MKKEQILKVLSLQPLMELLDLEDFTQEEQLELINQLEDAHSQLLQAELAKLLSEQDLQDLEKLEDDKILSFFESKNINIQNLSTQVFNFLVDHINDYQKGVDEFIKQQTNGS